MERNICGVTINSAYSAALTTERFMFHEMRTVAELMAQGLSDKEILKQIHDSNLFQMKSQASERRLAGVCIRRLRAMNDMTLVKAINSELSDNARQICLYAMMKQSRVVWDFMIHLIGEKYAGLDFGFSRHDVSRFISDLKAQSENVAAWSDATTEKICARLVGILAETGFINQRQSTKLNEVLICPALERGIRNSSDATALRAFNCFD